MMIRLAPPWNSRWRSSWAFGCTSDDYFEMGILAMDSVHRCYFQLKLGQSKLRASQLQWRRLIEAIRSMQKTTMNVRTPSVSKTLTLIRTREKVGKGKLKKKQRKARGNNCKCYLMFGQRCKEVQTFVVCPLQYGRFASHPPKVLKFSHEPLMYDFLNTYWNIFFLAI